MKKNKTKTKQTNNKQTTNPKNQGLFYLVETYYNLRDVRTESVE